MTRARALVVAGTLVACSSHFAGRLDVAAPSSRYPISMSTVLADEHGVVAPDRVDTVGSFSWQAPTCTLGSVDLSTAINDQIAKAGGDAMLAFTLETRPGKQCLDLRATGTIVKVRAAAGGS